MKLQALRHSKDCELSLGYQLSLNPIPFTGELQAALFGDQIALSPPSTTMFRRLTFLVV